jgi:transcriptional regulator with XRE-family HTH domain
MDNVRLGNSYRALRLRRRWRQLDLAAAAGLSREKVSRIERGILRRCPSVT